MWDAICLGINEHSIYIHSMYICHMYTFQHVVVKKGILKLGQHIEEGHTTKWPKEKGRKGKRSTKHYKEI